MNRPTNAEEFVRNLGEVIYERAPSSWMGVLASAVGQTQGCLVQEALGGVKECKTIPEDRYICCGHTYLTEEVSWLTPSEVTDLINASDSKNLRAAIDLHIALAKKYIPDSTYMQNGVYPYGIYPRAAVQKEDER